MKEILTRGLAIGALAAGALAMSSCADYEGSGNSFDIEARVTEVGDLSLQVDITDVLDAHGKAVGWFEDGKLHRVHNNYQTCNIALKHHYIGEVLDASGVKEDLSDVEVGDQVDIKGKIRDSNYHCQKNNKHYHPRPVFDELVVLEEAGSSSK